MTEKRPVCTSGIVSRMKAGMFTCHGWPSVCRDETGTLSVVCSGYRCLHICPFGKTLLFQSRDDGKTWSAPIVVNDTALDDRDAGILSLGGQHLMVTWFVHPAHVYLDRFAAGIKNDASVREAPVVLGALAAWEVYRDRPELGGSFIRHSYDGGMTWGETIRIPVSSPHGPTRLSDGRLLYVGKQMYAAEEPDGIVAAYESRDEGLTWQRLARIAFPEGEPNDLFHEPHAIELPDGSIFCAIRTEKPFSFRTTRSTDGGRTWTPLEETGFCGSPPHLMLHSSGALICSFGRRTEPFGERAAVSYDGGRTWAAEYILRDDAPYGDLGYPATVELPGGDLLTVYYQACAADEKPSILWTRWRLS